MMDVAPPRREGPTGPPLPLASFLATIARRKSKQTVALY
jgi:hypothetical protein